MQSKALLSRLRSEHVILGGILMKTLLLITSLFFSNQLFASQNKDKIQSSMKSYVNHHITDSGYLPVIHEGKVLKLKISKSKKYPDGFHTGVHSDGKLHTSCADFTDDNGTKYDVDFLVNKTSKGFKVVQPIVHSINGKKNRYDLKH